MISPYLHLIAGCTIDLLVHSNMSEMEFGILLKAGLGLGVRVHVTKENL